MKKGYSQPRNTARDQADFHDLAFAAERVKRPILGAIPAPISTYEEGELKGQEKINPHVTRLYLGKRWVLRKGWKPRLENEYMDVFHIKPIYYLHIDGSWRPMSEVASHVGNHKLYLKEDWDENMDLRFMAWLMRRMELFGKKGAVYVPSPSWMRPVKSHIGLSRTTQKEMMQVSFSTSTFYPDPHPETTSMDGNIGNDGGYGSNWAGLRAVTNADSFSYPIINDSGTTLAMLNVNTASDGNLRRIWALFDTSALGSTANISDGVLSMYATAKNDANSISMVLVQSSPASNTGLIGDDFDTCGSLNTPTEGASRKTLASHSTSAYNDFTLNTDGKSWIAKTGVTKLGLRGSLDVDNGSGSNNQVTYSSADQGSTTQDPKLVVTYTSATQYDQTISATVAMAASMLTPKTIVQAVSASVAGSASISMIKDFVRTLDAGATATASVLKGLAQTLGATVEVTASMTAERVYLVAMTALTSATATIDKTVAYVRTLGATATATASMARQIATSVAMTAETTITATIELVREIVMTATVTTAATMTTMIGKTLDAGVSILAKISAPFWRTKYPAHGDEDDYEIKYPHD